MSLRTRRARLGELAGAGVLRAFFRGGPSLSEESAERGDLALTPGISPRASLRLSVEFHLFLMALSVLCAAQERFFIS